jgi:hypothetical protein
VLTPDVIARVRRRAGPLGIQARCSGIEVNAPRRVLNPDLKPVRAVSWVNLAAWAEVYARTHSIDPERSAILAGEKEGTPVVDVGEGTLGDLALVLVCPGPVYARIGLWTIHLD